MLCLHFSGASFRLEPFLQVLLVIVLLELKLAQSVLVNSRSVMIGH